jgi:hypothetical protein
MHIKYFVKSFLFWIVIFTLMGAFGVTFALVATSRCPPRIAIADVVITAGCSN